MTADRPTGEALWRSLLEAISPRVSNHVFETWIRPIRCVGHEAGVIRLEVRDLFARDWLRDHYLDVLREQLATLAGEPLAIEWEIARERVPAADASQDDEPSSVTEAIEPTAARPRQLNPRYTFDNFVTGPSNQLAFAACKAVADNPGRSYNPLFIYGGVGLGKTHLLSAIAAQVLANNPKARILYSSSEQFVLEVVNAVRFSKIDEFHNKYRRNCDVFLVDDIQLLAGKERTQNEFFHLFNVLRDSQRQIVLTSDKLPHEIPDIDERLRSRFGWGLIADIQPPEMETRVAILRMKAESERITIDDELAFFLAKNIRSNVRELEGALVRLMAHVSLTGAPLTVEYARTVLADVLTQRTQQLSVEAIQKLVAGYYQVRVADLKSSRRQHVLVRPRQVAMYLCRKHAGASYPELGSRFGDKDHTTIMSACRKVEGLLRGDSELRKEVLDLERRLDVNNPK